MTDQRFSVREATWNADADAIRLVRKAVFVAEQGIPESLEWDNADADCRHWLVEDETGRPVATARLRRNGQLGRMAVLADRRGQGIGRWLLQKILDSAGDDARLWLNAQTNVTGFYAKSGFRPTGAVFMEAGIPHRKMEYVRETI